MSMTIWIVRILLAYSCKMNGIVWRKAASFFPKRFCHPFVAWPQSRRSFSDLIDKEHSLRYSSPTYYHDCFIPEREKAAHEILTGPKRFQSIRERGEKSILPLEGIKAQCKGKYLTTHKGCLLMKGPHDLIIYLQLFWYLKPSTLIELGSLSGGSALWMADILKMMDIDCQIYSVDVDLSLIEDGVKEHKPNNLTFLEGDCYAIGDIFTAEMMSTISHPLLLIDDVHVNTPGVLEHFHQYFQPGDYVVTEDTNPEIPLQPGSGLFTDDYQLVGPAKLKDVKDFLLKYEEYYAVDSFFSDFYGYNSSFNWNGYIKRMK